MGRGATKARSNVWYQARIAAAKWNPRLSSRMGAAEELHVDEDAVKSVELDLYKSMPVDTAVLMADLYNAPDLLDYYCLNECPIGRHHSISDQVISLDRATVKLVNLLRSEKVEGFKDAFLEIAEDGEITGDEIAALDSLLKWLDKAGKVISETKNMAERRRRELQDE